MASKLSIGIVGLPNVGKSTLFNALTKKSVPAENYPFCTIDPSVGIVPVPDERLEKLNEFSKSQKKVPAVVEFTDIAGLVKGASQGEGLGNQFLSHIRECDAIAEVVRVFEDKDILHVEGGVHPDRDIETINYELILADLQTVIKRREGLAKELKGANRKAQAEDQELAEAERILKEGKMLGPDFKTITLQLLTQKPILYVFNTSSVSENWNIENSLKIVNCKLKINSYVMVDPVFEKGLDDLIKKAYETLDLITFFTTGEDETRGWTIKRNSTAPEAGAAIHTDFRDKFIRAEVIAWGKLLEAGSYSSAREKGWLRTEGKQYIVQDGDVVEFKI